MRKITIQRGERIQHFDENLANDQVEIHLEPNARLDHVRVFDQGEGLISTSHLRVTQEAGSQYYLHTLIFSGGQIKNETDVVLDGEGAECHLYGLDVASGQQRIENITRIEHRQPRCVSVELQKGIFDDESIGKFEGSILVSPGAAKTQSSQMNRNLLLSKNAAAYTKPHLEIYHDDVKCTHGATIGQLDADALFYLQARGIDLLTAKTMLTQAFATEILDSIPILSVKKAYENRLRR